jgi:hypothetical protein
MAKSTDLLNVMVTGSTYTGVTTLNFTNHSHLYDAASNTINIGKYLYQRTLQLGTGAQNGDLTNEAGDLTWDGNKLATSIDLGGKQDALDYYAESLTHEITILQGLDTSSLHIAWAGSYTNVAGSHQVIPTGGSVTKGLYDAATNGAAGNLIYMTCDMRGVGSCLECAFAVSDAVTWAGAPEVVISGLNTTSFTSVTWSFPLPANRQMYFVVGGLPVGSSLSYTSGSVHMRNFRLHRKGGLSTISSQLSCGNVACSGSVTATSFTSTSDQAVKENVQNASLEDCTRVLREVDVKSYNRTDIPGPRIGFIAQDLQRSLPEEFANIMGMQYGGDQPLLALSYDRLVCVLWGACKALTARVDALELLAHP